jgi:CubicO group peptidase (beta-lactamase class C family)
MRQRLLILLLMLMLPVGSITIASGQTGDTLRQIDELFARYHNGMPGVAVAISRNGAVIYNKAFGLADMEHMVPNTTETIFECGSVSKQFTAAAILLLIQDGKLSVDDDVRKYLPELPQYDAPITIRHLLSHTSGLKDWGAVYSLTGWPRSTRVYTQELGFDIVFRQKTLNFTPGSEYSYSNSNYVMLVLITERVSGKSLAEFTRERLFEPLGMKSTKWRDDYREVIPGRAVAYSETQGRYIMNMPFENLHGPGGLLTTTADMLRWNELLESDELFNKNTALLRIEPGMLNDGSSSGYAAGLMTGRLNGFEEISHSGATAGYRAWLAWYPEKRLSVAILSNYASFNPNIAGRDIASLFVGKEAATTPIQPPATQVVLTTGDRARWTGIWFNEQTAEVLRITESEGKVVTGNQAYTPLHRDTLRRGNQTYVLGRDNTILLGTRVYRKAEPVLTGIEALSRYSGRYYSADADVAYTIETRGEEVWVYRKAGDSFRLLPAFRDGFSTLNNGFFRFTRDRRGNVTGFTVSVSRAANVPFVRD